MSTLARIGIVELTAGVLSGWLMVAISDRARARRLGVVHPHRIRQMHLELLMMGAILVAAGTALPDAPALAVALVAVGSWVAPLAFLPVAFAPSLGDHAVARAVDRLAFVALSVGWVLLAVEALGGG
jgi:hypothetical protein